MTLIYEDYEIIRFFYQLQNLKEKNNKIVLKSVELNLVKILSFSQTAFSREKHLATHVQIELEIAFPASVSTLETERTAPF